MIKNKIIKARFPDFIHLRLETLLGMTVTSFCALKYYDCYCIIVSLNEKGCSGQFTPSFLCFRYVVYDPETRGKSSREGSLVTLSKTPVTKQWRRPSCTHCVRFLFRFPLILNRFFISQRQEGKKCYAFINSLESKKFDLSETLKITIKTKKQ